MVRVLRYFFIVALFAGFAVWLTEQSGSVELEWGGYLINTSFGVLAFALIIFAIVVGLAYRFWLFLRHAPQNISGAWGSRRRTKGYQALTKGMVAVAAGDADEARKQARKAEGLLSEPPLTMLLSAQAAQLSGDERAAERFFRAMTENKETEFLGLRGLLNQAMKRDDTVGALLLARRAHRMHPDSAWVSDSLFELQTRSGQWLDAQVTAREALRHRHTSQQQSKRHQAALALQLGMDAAAAGDGEDAFKQAKTALDLDANLLPAIMFMAEQFLSNGKNRKAISLIERAWGQSPHPDLGALYCKAHQADDALAQVKTTQRLAGFNLGHIESDLAVASAALQAQLWGEARQHLEKISSQSQGVPSVRLCHLFAQLEEFEHQNSTLAKGWLMKAVQASPDPIWFCRDCGNAVTQWHATCGNCDGFDTFEWRTPPHVLQLATHALDDTASGISLNNDTLNDKVLIDHQD